MGYICLNSAQNRPKIHTNIGLLEQLSRGLVFAPKKGVFLHHNLPSFYLALELLRVDRHKPHILLYL